ncbi:hypothetical protein [Streptomyces endophytica]|uniref:Uncharacterized protein n=1 Tax=Streptomyces endophytica TaxID=2991496 RepID=A0ABY6PA36_9ACTN|nr:hypothetical protein [Streptomyces endophytica]UZJ30684.1 hypothetical protein OJ254_10345 [Streptomyces endophytica]
MSSASGPLVHGARVPGSPGSASDDIGETGDGPDACAVGGGAGVLGGGVGAAVGVLGGVGVTGGEDGRAEWDGEGPAGPCGPP